MVTLKGRTMKMNKKALAILSAAHLVTDINPGALPVLLLCVMLSGIGVASFHPEGFKTAHFFTGDKKATGLTTVMAQALLPQHLGMASGMMVGFSMSAGGIGVTLLGTIADTWGYRWQ